MNKLERLNKSIDMVCMKAGEIIYKKRIVIANKSMVIGMAVVCILIISCFLCDVKERLNTAHALLSNV